MESDPVCQVQTWYSFLRKQLRAGTGFLSNVYNPKINPSIEQILYAEVRFYDRI